MDSKPVKNKYNFYQYDPLPTEAELENFYKNQYFQGAERAAVIYQHQYDDEELKWKKMLIELTLRVALSHMPDVGRGVDKAILDIGCGEGLVMQFMHGLSWKVQGIDFSADAISRSCPDMLPFFRQGDFYEILVQDQSQKYDLIHLGNVIEHVREPVRLLELILDSLTQRGILVMTAPNDFSELQRYLLEKKFAHSQYWLHYPDHINYFNKHAMTALLSALGYKIIDLLCDFPMEFNLFSPHTNYYLDKTVGKKVHWQRIHIENFLYWQDPQILVDLYRVMANHGLGRNIIYYCQKAE